MVVYNVFWIQLQVPFEDNTSSFSKGHVDQFPDLYSVYDINGKLTEQKSHNATFGSGHAHPSIENKELFSKNFEPQFNEGELYSATRLNSENDISKEGSISYSLALKQSLVDGEESLKKVDSFSRWVSRELVEVDDLHMHPSSGLSWSTVECGDMVDDSSLSPSLSEDQLFSITDFSPKSTLLDLETEVKKCLKKLKKSYCESSLREKKKTSLSFRNLLVSVSIFLQFLIYLSLFPL